MIIKSFELKKINIYLNNFLLFYGKNDGLKNEEIIKFKSKFNTIEKYDEKQILENTHNFFQQVMTGSLFEKEKLIIINQATDKINKIVDELMKQKVDDILFIFNADNLDTRSKLRKNFEKEKKLVCVPFYPDTNETLFKLVHNFFKEKQIVMSNENINFIINKCSGNRGYLYNELKKIELYTLNKKKITTEDLLKLINLTENYNIAELIDNCLAKNQKKTISILNENNFGNEECIIIARTFLNKLKRNLKLSNDYQKNKNIDLIINNAKPPIFWKDKEITKQQILKWDPADIENLIYDLSNIEMQIKKNSQNPINIISNFILEKTDL